MKIRHYIYILFASFALLSCVKEEVLIQESSQQILPKPSDPKGINLSVTVDLDKMVGGSDVQVGTKAVTDPTYENYIRNAEHDYISSLAVFLIRIDGDKQEDKNIVAYRLIAPPSSDGETYMEMTDPAKGTYNTTYKLSDLSFYNQNQPDDQNYFTGVTDNSYDEYGNIKTGVDDDGNPYYTDVKGWGYNGYAAMNYVGTSGGFDSNMKNYETDFAIYDGTLHPRYDDDGKYDFDFATPMGKEYPKGSKMAFSKSVILTFLYDHPMHGETERLTEGTYRVVAVSNFRESISHVYGPSSVDGTDANFNSVGYTTGKSIFDLVKYFDENKGKEGFKGIPWKVFYPFFHGVSTLEELNMGTDGIYSNSKDTDGYYQTKDGKRASFIRSARAHILATAIEDKVCKSDNNVLSLDLTRLNSRATFTISNYSKETLKITDFSLSDNFAQGSSYLFPQLNQDLLYRSEWRGAPHVEDYNKALVSWKDPEHKVNNQTNDIIPPFTSKVFFDALLYETGVDKDDSKMVPLSYTIGVQYEGCQQTYKVAGSFSTLDLADKIQKNTVVTETAAEKLLEDVQNDNVYVMIKARGNHNNNDGGAGEGFMYITSEAATVAEAKPAGYLNSTIDVGEGYLWRLENAGDNQIYVFNCLQEKYIQATGGDFSYVNNQTDATKFTLKAVNEVNNRNIALTYNSGGSCWHSYNNGNYKIGTYTEINDAGSAFAFYTIDVSVRVSGWNNRTYSADSENLSNNRYNSTQYVRDYILDDILGALDTASPDELYFLIKARGGTGENGAGRFVYYDDQTKMMLAESDAKVQSKMLEETIDADAKYLWAMSLVPGTTDQVYIRNMWSTEEMYLSAADVDNESVYKFVSKENATPFTLVSSSPGTGPDRHLVIKDSNGRCLHSYDGGNLEVKCYTYLNDDGSAFAFYIIPPDDLKNAKEVTEDVKTSKTIDITAYEGNTANAETLYYLRRNNHLNVHIGVSYNTQTQNIEYELKPWEKINNSVTFELYCLR